MQLYALCDQALLDDKTISLYDYLQLIKPLDIKILQYRNKISDVKYITKQLKILRKYYDGCLIINDFIELVYLCDGIHIGQDDLDKIDTNSTKAIRLLRQTIGEKKIIGLSTHNEQEIKEANKLDINYVGLGAYKKTNTKDVINVLGDKLDKIAVLSNHKVVAIGGVQLNDKFENVTHLAIGSGLL